MKKRIKEERKKHIFSVKEPEHHKDVAKDTARIIVTLTCPRDCDGCCNGAIDWQKNVSKIKYPSQVVNFYDNFVLSGGEPLYGKYAFETFRHIKTLRSFAVHSINIFVQTAYFDIYDSPTIASVRSVDGVNYTLHKNYTEKEFKMLLNLDTFLVEDNLVRSTLHMKRRSDKLIIEKDALDERVEEYLKHQRGFEKVQIIEWKDDCPLPSNEKLFLIDLEQEKIDEIEEEI